MTEEDKELIAGYMGMKANAEHFFKAFEHCMKCEFTRQQAMVMSRGFSRRGLIDASEGCSHYALMMLAG